MTAITSVIADSMPTRPTRSRPEALRASTGESRRTMTATAPIVSRITTSHACHRSVASEARNPP